MAMMATSVAAVVMRTTFLVVIWSSYVVSTY
jgi:hypothetical protein